MSQEIPIYPTLYKNKSKMGKISKWDVKIMHGSDGTTMSIVVSFGEIDGKQQTHVTEITKGKANRSILQQTILEANSKWNEKKNRDGYSEMPTPTPTTPTTTIRPMLATTASLEKPKIKFPAFVQRKYDGIRCIAHFIKDENRVILESRKGLNFPFFEHIKRELLHVFLTHPHPHIQNLYFDGELYCHNMPFEKLNGIVRLTKELNNEETELVKNIQYHIYDCFTAASATTATAPFKERLEWLSELPKTLETIVVVETVSVESVEDIKTQHRIYVEEGFEGTMIRDTNGQYEPNKRSKYLQKYKEFMEDEFEIVGFHDGEGIDKDAVIWNCVTKEGRTFSVKPKTTIEERKRIFKEGDKYIGKQLTVVFQEYSADSIPRFPIGKNIRDEHL